MMFLNPKYDSYDIKEENEAFLYKINKEYLSD